MNPFKSYTGYFDDALRRMCLERYGNQDQLSQACLYALEGNGKRVRPVLAFLCAEMLGVSREKALVPALALEMIHTYSLVHDDLPVFDDDDERRGRPTVHVRFDEQTAVLAGDALLTDAFSILSEFQEGSLSADVRLKLIRELSHACGGRGLVQGQMMDVFWTGKQNYSYDDLRFIHSKKTGSLIAASCVMGGLVAGGDPQTISLLRKFGEFLGLAFQVSDDLLDDLQGTGKTPGKDAVLGKLTYLKFMSRKQAESLASDMTGEALEALASLRLLSFNPSQLEKLATTLLNRTK